MPREKRAFFLACFFSFTFFALLFVSLAAFAYFCNMIMDYCIMIIMMN